MMAMGLPKRFSREYMITPRKTSSSVTPGPNPITKRAKDTRDAISTGCMAFWVSTPGVSEMATDTDAGSKSAQISQAGLICNLLIRNLSRGDFSTPSQSSLSKKYTARIHAVPATK
ncbi:hypothetical protein SDC9_142719 [bioreactor metagenome]|uniref:Uncharacterized protein n=1 Tax=bioreactor metagenome TaxID=1076179 RepID=A0A645E199_9ZZZZ